MREPPTRTPWVIVAGGVHSKGGMDKANLALAEYLIEHDVPLHLVAHAVEPRLEKNPRATVHLVSRPAGSYLLGERRLDAVGRRVTRDVLAQHSCARVVVNGGNCLYPADINWVHCVHHAWPCVDVGAPAWFRLKNRIVKQVARRREATAIGRARLILANSQKTRQDLICRLGIPGSRIHTLYLGCEPAWGPPTRSERERAKARFAGSGGGPVVAFVGALSHDNNKGFDTLWAAWSELSRSRDWDASLVVAGSGNKLARWQSVCGRAGFNGRVRFLGFTEPISEILAAADLLVSPVRYEAYGLNVQEAICRGVPALVSASAGVAARYPAELSPMLLPDPENVSDLVVRLRAWRSQMSHWRALTERFGERLQAYSWQDMASRIVSLAEQAADDGDKRNFC